MKNILKLIICMFSFLFIFSSNINSQDIIVKTSKGTYFHNEFIDIEVQTSKKIRKNISSIYLTVKSSPSLNEVNAIGDTNKIKLKYNPSTSKWIYNYPCPWNLKEGLYTYKIDIAYQKELKNLPTIKYIPFEIKQRKLDPSDANQNLKVLTFESLKPIRNLNIYSPLNNEYGNYSNIFDWLEYLGGNTFWYLATGTNYSSYKLKDDFPWVKYNLPYFKKLGKIAHSRDFKFGVWIMAYLTGGKKSLAPAYDYAIGYDFKTKELFKTRAISILDEKRIEDMIKVLKPLANTETIDYIGIDYIRNALGGYELVDPFCKDMNIEINNEEVISYKCDTSTKNSCSVNITKNDRMIWLARKLAGRLDKGLLDKWYWYRAYKVSNIVKRIKKELNTDKPIWVFTLSWEKGWQHGQDPVMMNDGGADIDAVMLYEANREQFDNLIGQWNKYVNKLDVRLITGNVIDWYLHQKTLNPAGPEEYYYRSIKGINEIYKKGISYGVFQHDLSRLLWGNHGPYSRNEWASACGAVFTQFDKLNNKNIINVKNNTKIDEIFISYKTIVSFNIENILNSSIKCEIKPIVYPEIDGLSTTELILNKNAKKEINYEVIFSTMCEKRKNRVLLGLNVNTYDIKTGKVLSRNYFIDYVDLKEVEELLVESDVIKMDKKEFIEKHKRKE